MRRSMRHSALPSVNCRFAFAKARSSWRQPQTRKKTGCRRLESTHTEDWREAQRQLRERLLATDNNTLHIVRKGEQITFYEWADFFLENYSKPPIRAQGTYEVNENALKSLRPVFGPMKLTEIGCNPTAPSAEAAQACPSEGRNRGARTFTTCYRASGISSPSAHPERGRQKEALSNPCASVEFPVILKGPFRPHFMTWSEQQAIESQAPGYFRNVIRILTETGLRLYKELAPLARTRLI